MEDDPCLLRLYAVYTASSHLIPLLCETEYKQAIQDQFSSLEDLLPLLCAGLDIQLDLLLDALTVNVSGNNVSIVKLVKKSSAHSLTLMNI